MSDWIFEIDGVLYNEDTGEMCMQPKYKSKLIRCENCKYKRIENLVYTCPFGMPGGPSFYCGYGEEEKNDV